MPDTPRVPDPSVPDQPAAGAPQAGRPEVPRQRGAAPDTSGSAGAGPVEPPTVVHEPVRLPPPMAGAVFRRPAPAGYRRGPGPRPAPWAGPPAARPVTAFPAVGAPLPAPRREPVPAGHTGHTAHTAHTAAGTAVDTATGTAPAKAPELTLNKVIAGAGAAATSAVVGSYLGAAGTVLAAALGSAVSIVGASLYQRSLDRTRDTVKAKIRLPSGRTVAVDEQVAVPAPRTDAGAAAPTELLVAPTGAPAGAAALSPAVGSRTRRRWLATTAGVVLAFVIGMVAVTGVEWAKGSSLSGSESGTSVGRVLGGDRGPAAAPDTGGKDDDGGSDRSDPSDARDGRSADPTSRAPGATREPTRTTEPRPTTSAPTTTAPSTVPDPTSVLPSTSAPAVGIGQG